MDDLLETVQPGMLRAQLDPLRSKVRGLPNQPAQGRPLFRTHRIRILRSDVRQIPTVNLTMVTSAVVDRPQLAFRYVAATMRLIHSTDLPTHFRDQAS